MTKILATDNSPAKIYTIYENTKMSRYGSFSTEINTEDWKRMRTCDSIRIDPEEYYSHGWTTALPYAFMEGG